MRWRGVVGTLEAQIVADIKPHFSDALLPQRHGEKIAVNSFVACNPPTLAEEVAVPWRCRQPIERGEARPLAESRYKINVLESPVSLLWPCIRVIGSGTNHFNRVRL